MNLVIFFLAVSFGSITLLVFADASLGYVLTSLHLQTDPNAPLYPTGSKAGQVVLYSEVLITATIWVWGMLSDRIGRRWVFVAGTLLIAISFVSMPFATTFAQVVVIRLVFAPGAAACSAMLMALICDYPRDDTHSRSRGKASAIMGILAGLGALFALFVLLRIPGWFSGGSSSISSRGLMYMFFAAAAVSLISGLVSTFGLAKKSSTMQTEHAGLKAILTSGISAMKDPYVVLAYLASFAARGDASIVTLFLSIWIQTAALGQCPPGEPQSTCTASALAHAGEVSGIVQVVALLAAPAIGICADRFSRAAVTMVVSVLGLMGYLLLGLLDNPNVWYVANSSMGEAIQLGLALLFLGIGEMGILIMSQSILALHAPTATRGSISGFWALCGSLGIMFGSGVGGLLYPLNPGSPFFIFAAFNCIVASFALFLYIKERRARSASSFDTVSAMDGETEKLVVQ